MMGNQLAVTEAGEQIQRVRKCFAFSDRTIGSSIADAGQTARRSRLTGSSAIKGIFFSCSQTERAEAGKGETRRRLA